MRNRKGAGRVILLLALVMALSFAGNLFSTLKPIAVNQDMAALPDVSLAIYCASDPENFTRTFETISVVDGFRQICTTDQTGRCHFMLGTGIEGCFGCAAGSRAMIKAKYYSIELTQDIQGWQGYSCVGPQNNIHCCYAAENSQQYYTEPRNELAPFVFTTHTLVVLGVNENGTAIEGADVTANSPDAFYVHCKTNVGGECRIENIPQNAGYNIQVSWAGLKNETTVFLDQDKTVRLMLARAPPPAPNISVAVPAPQIPATTPNVTVPILIPGPSPVAGNTSGPVVVPKPPPGNNYWFLYLMNKTDELIGEAKPAKLKLVFVPVGYSEEDYGEFEKIANSSTAFFISASPFKECPNPSLVIEAVLLDISACNLKSCSDIQQDCQSIVQECASKEAKGFYRAVGICNGVACGGVYGICGSAAGIPATTAVINSRACSSPIYMTVSHELGHTLGLYHTKSENGTNGCRDDESGACLGPNAADCSLSAIERSKNMMAYCPNREEYGPAAYGYLKEKFGNYRGVCK